MTIDRQAVDDLVGWMVDGARPSADSREIIDGICRRLVAAGVPVSRFALFIYTLHPNLVGWRFSWTPQEGVATGRGQLGLFSTEEYLVNPLPRVIETRTPLRRRLADPDCPHDYRIVGELIAGGFTDYLAQPVIYTTGETNVASWSTKAPGGFSDEATAVLERVNAPLARLTEIYLLRVNAANILSAYVGRGGGEQILSGRIHRGDGEEIDAAILFLDIANFTAMSNAMAGPEVVAMLNDAFDILIPPVEARGGQILKFLGDGFLAIFPYREEAALAEAVRAAGDAVKESEALLAAAPVSARVAFRSAVHAGRFHFGNVGGASRLDFTAIGQPVNYTARLIQAGSALARPRVASALAAGHLGSAARRVGEVEFKGFAGKQPVFTY